MQLHEYALIRPVFRHEAAAVLDLIRRSIHKGCRAAYGDALVDAWINPREGGAFVLPPHSLLAIQQGVLLGVIGWRPYDDHGVAEICNCFAAPEGAGRGAMAALLYHAVDWARAEGRTRFYSAATLNAEGFYLKHGFAAAPRERMTVIPGRQIEVVPVYGEGPQRPSGLKHLNIREARNSDAGGLIALIKSCFDEYDGVYMDLDNDDANLKAIRSHARAEGGNFWVLEGPDGAILGSIGYALKNKALELKRLYLAAELRGSGLASDLTQLVMDAAMAHGRGFVELWSDVKFTRAHAYYDKIGFTRTGEVRALGDISDTHEYRFVLAMAPRETG